MGACLVPRRSSVVPAAMRLPSAVPGALVGGGDATGPSRHWQPDSPLLLLLFQLFTPNCRAGACALLLTLSTAGLRSRYEFGPSRLQPQGLRSIARPFGCHPKPAGADGRTSVNFRSYSKCWISFIVEEQILIFSASFCQHPRRFYLLQLLSLQTVPIHLAESLSSCLS